MPKMEPLAAPGGVEQLFVLLDVLRNPEAVRERLDTLEQARAAANAAIALVGTAESIPLLQATTVEQNRRATERLESAKQQAAEIVRDAAAQRDVAFAEADQARADLAAIRAAIRDEQQQWAMEKAAGELRLVTLDGEARQAQAEAEAARAEALAFKAEWEERTTKLNEAMGR